MTGVRAFEDEVVHVVYLPGPIRGDQTVIYTFRSTQAGLACEHPTCGACPYEQPVGLFDYSLSLVLREHLRQRLVHVGRNIVDVVAVSDVVEPVLQLRFDRERLQNCLDDGVRPACQEYLESFAFASSNGKGVEQFPSLCSGLAFVEGVDDKNYTLLPMLEWLGDERTKLILKRASRDGRISLHGLGNVWCEFGDMLNELSRYGRAKLVGGRSFAAGHGKEESASENPLFPPQFHYRHGHCGFSRSSYVAQPEHWLPR